MYAAFPLSRGRSPNAHLCTVTLPDTSGHRTYQARGLRTGCDAFEPGAFIGFYTGRWGTRVQLGGANPYMLDVGDDHWHVAPPGSRACRVDLMKHAMAAINEPGPEVIFARARTLLSTDPPTDGPR